MMKIIIAAFLIIATFTGCKKWLDVQPSDQVTDSKLFSESMGFRHSLNGIYIQAATKDLYGFNLTRGLNSALAQDYEIGKCGLNKEIADEFNQGHPNSRQIIDNTWSLAFNTISNCNKLLKEIEVVNETKFMFGRSERNLIIGEAMAMRALMHLEILRLYAPSLKEAPDAQYIPYVTNYPAKINTPISNRKVVEQIVADLESAQVLVAENDTIVNRITMEAKLGMLTGSGLIPAGGMFFQYRMTRLNIAAIQGLLARTYLYAGNYSKAKDAAKLVYETYGPHGRLKWWGFTPETNTQGLNKFHKLADDILVGFYDAALVTSDDARGYSAYRISNDCTQWFPGSDRDYRALLLKEHLTDNAFDKGKISEKWIATTSTYFDAVSQNTIIPVLRLSEIYYIYSEALFKDGAVNDALDILNQVRQARGKTSTFSQTGEDAFYLELLTEYRREFLTEGQTIFAYKRLQRNIVRGTTNIPMDKRFTLSIPENEQIL